MTDNRADLLKLHDWDELIFGGFYCLHCTPDDAWDHSIPWPCQPLLDAGVTLDDARQTIAQHRDEIEAKHQARAAELRAKKDEEKRKGQQAAADFNAHYPVGTRVIAYPSVRPEYNAAIAAKTRLVTTTRTPAWTLGHGEPVVSVHGYAGGITLEHVDIDHDSPLRDGEHLAHVLTVENISRIDNWLDGIDVFAKGYWENVNGKLVNTGLRIGEKPGHVVAKFGDTIIWRADGSFTVRTAVTS
jgi:hypothetical protein